MQCDSLWTHVHLATMRSAVKAPYGEIRDAAIAVRGDRIAWIGRHAELPADLHPNRTIDPSGEAWDAYIWVDDADALYAEFKSKGVTIARDICDQPYGCRDFDVEDCNGYRLCFGHDLGR